jgi:imidazolonepropionase-like amidohydrolase
VALAVDHFTGILEKGEMADLLVVRGDPLDNIALLQNMNNILVVMKEGRIVVRRKDQENLTSP